MNISGLLHLKDGFRVSVGWAMSACAEPNIHFRLLLVVAIIKLEQSKQGCYNLRPRREAP